MSQAITPANSATRSKKEKQEQFLASFNNLPNLTAAAEAINISRNSVYSWIRKDQNFRAVYQKAVTMARLIAKEDLIENELNEALRNVVRQLNHVADPSQFSDKLLMKILRIRKKAEYNHNQAVEEQRIAVIQVLNKIREDKRMGIENSINNPKY